MPTREITDATLHESVAGNDIVLLDFWAGWCRPCQVFAPIFEEASERHPDILFGKVDTEAQPELAEAFEIASIPTLVAFREGVIVYAEPGAVRGPDLDQLIEAVRGLDMSDLHAEVAAQAGEVSR